MNVSPKDSPQQMIAVETSGDVMRRAGSLLATLALLRRDREYCDVFLQAENAARNAVVEEACGVWAHRVVLAAVSPFFYKMFYSNIKERSMQVMVLKDVEPETLQALVDIIYSPSSLPENVVSAKALLVAAKNLDVSDVPDAVCAFLARSLSVDNVIGIFFFAEAYTCAALSATAMEYIYINFELVLHENEFLVLTVDALRLLLDRADSVVSDECMLNAVLCWTRHRPQDRVRHLHSLFGMVQLSLIPQEVLTEIVCNDLLVRSEEDAFQLVTHALAGSYLSDA